MGSSSLLFNFDVKPLLKEGFKLGENWVSGSVVLADNLLDKRIEMELLRKGNSILMLL